MQVGVLLYTLASKLPATVPPSHRALLARWIADGRLKTVPQLSAALDYVNRHHHSTEKYEQQSHHHDNHHNEIDELALSTHCGVGVVVSTDTIELVVKVQN